MAVLKSRRLPLALTALLMLAVAVLATVTFGVSPADAHAFLVTSNPQPGQRLPTSPTEIVLSFSEPVVPSSPRVMVQTTSGTRARSGQLQLDSGGQTVRVAIPGLIRGIFEVTWSVTAQDGHDTTGEFAFAVGHVHGVLPAARTTGASVSVDAAAATVLFLAGIALALGGLFSEQFVWPSRSVTAGTPVPNAPVAFGLVAALVGSAAQLALLVGDERGGLGVSASWRAALGSRAGLLTAIELASCAYALSILRVPRLRPIALVPTGAAVLAAALRGHSGTTTTWWAGPANVVHLVLAGLWIGALTHLVGVLRRLEPDERRQAVTGSLHRYSTMAIVAVPPLLVAGVITALAQVAHPGDLVTTTYGWVLVTKLAIVALVLAVAFRARDRGLRPDGLNLAVLRRLTRAEIGGLFLVVVVSGVLTGTAPPVPAQPINSPLGAPPLQEPITRDANLAGQLAVYVSAASGRLRIETVDPEGNLAVVTRLEVEARHPDGTTVTLYPRGCGMGCATIQIDWPPGITSFTIRVAAHGWGGGTTDLSVQWPPGPDASALLSRVVATMRNQPSINVTEHVSSGPRSQSPDGPLTLTGPDFINREVYANGGAVDIRSRDRGGGLTDIELSLPGSQIWEQLTIDGTGRLRHEVIVDPGHLIERTFSYDTSP